MPSPGHRLQPFEIDFLSTRDALPEGPFANTVEGGVHHLKELALIVALRKERVNESVPGDNR